MEIPVSPDKLLPLALQAVQHLPNLHRRKTAPVEQRLKAYQDFGAAVWAAATAIGQVNYLAPFATKPLVGIWWHTMTTRSLERQMAQLAEMLGALERLRLVAPTDVRTKAEQVADRLSELAAVIRKPAEVYEPRQIRVGTAQLEFLAACRIDLGYDLNPDALALNWWNPVTWYRWARWQWIAWRR